MLENIVIYVYLATKKRSTLDNILPHTPFCLMQVMNSDSYYCSCISGFSGPACKVSTTAATAPTTAAASTGTPTCPVSCKHGQCLQQFNSDTYYCNCTTGLFQILGLRQEMEVESRLLTLHGVHHLGIQGGGGG